jgi:hypothetical protein
MRFSKWLCCGAAALALGAVPATTWAQAPGYPVDPYHGPFGGRVGVGQSPVRRPAYPVHLRPRRDYGAGRPNGFSPAQPPRPPFHAMPTPIPIPGPRGWFHQPGAHFADPDHRGTGYSPMIPLPPPRPIGRSGPWGPRYGNVPGFRP